MPRIAIIVGTPRPNRDGEQVARRVLEHAQARNDADHSLVRAQVALSVMTDFETFSTLKPSPWHSQAPETMLDQVVAWSSALAPLRSSAAAA
jgi:NAD(P)H-dependent FMN reductase